MTQTLLSATAVAIGEVALAIEGPPGSGKSSLALALIDRGATLIGDDGVSITQRANQLIVSPPPNIEGLIEVRGVGLFTLPLSDPMPLGLILSLTEQPERLPDVLETRALLGVAIPILPFQPGTLVPGMRAEMALARHGLTFSAQ